MKLTKKIMLFEDFSASASDNQNAQASSPTTANSVAVDATVQDAAGETLRTEVLKDVDSILTRLSELSDNIKEGLNIHEAFNQYEILLEELMEEEVTEEAEELNEKIIDIIKNPIKYTKIKNNLKKYQKALVQISINDVDFAKKMQASDADSSKGTERRATLDAANTAKNKALKDQADAISARMTELAVSDGLKLIVTSGKNKAKLKAAKIVMKATSGEEAKQLQLKIETLEDRIADDGKSLKDYAQKNPAPAETSNDDEGSNSSQAAQDAMDANAKKAKEAGKKEGGKKDDGGKKEDGGKKDDGKKEDGGNEEEIEKLKKKSEEVQTKIDDLPKGPNGQPTSKPKKAEVELQKLELDLKAAETEGDQEKVKELKDKIAAAKKTASLKPGGASGKKEDDGKKEDGGKKEDDGNVTEEGLEIVEEATLAYLMAYDADEDNYEYLKSKAKELGVKVAVHTGDDSPYWDMNYDALTYTGKKDAILKLAAISGHDADICDPGDDCGGYELTENATELPKTISLTEGMSIAQKFKALM